MLSAWLWSFAFQKGQAGLQCGSPLGSPRLLWGVGGCRRGRAGGGGGAGGRVRGAAGAAGLPPPEPFRSAEPGAAQKSLGRALRGHRSSADPGRSWPDPTCLRCFGLGSLPAGLSAAGLGGCLFGGDLGPTVWTEHAGSAWVAGGNPAQCGDVSQISGVYGERRVAGIIWLCCTEAEKKAFP